MAGETAVVYAEPVFDHEPPSPVATTWLLALWLIGATTAAAGLTWAILTPSRWPAGVLVYASGALYGGPLFIITWLWLSRSVVCLHGPFVMLVAFWAVGFAILATRLNEEFSRLASICVAAVPLVSCILLLRIVVRIRARQARYFVVGIR